MRLRASDVRLLVGHLGQWLPNLVHLAEVVHVQNLREGRARSVCLSWIQLKSNVRAVNKESEHLRTEENQCNSIGIERREHWHRVVP